MAEAGSGPPAVDTDRGKSGRSYRLDVGSYAKNQVPTSPRPAQTPATSHNGRLHIRRRTQLQALQRRHRDPAAGPGRDPTGRVRVRRGGTLAYLAALDVHHARVIGTIADTTGIVPFAELVTQVMSTEPPTPQPGGCSGSSTTAPPVRVRPHMSFCVRPDMSLGELSPLLV